MRHTFTLLASLLTIACTVLQAQPIDSVRISFSGKPAATGQVSAADGSYKIPPSTFDKAPALPGLVRVDPSQLTGSDSVLKITSYSQLADRAPMYQFQSRRFPYHQNPHAFREYMNEFYRLLVVHPDSTQRALLTGLEQDSISFLWIDRNHTAHRIDESYVKYESFLLRTDSVIRLLEPQIVRYRSEQLQPIVDELLEPFYISRTEISNRQYRTFVNWVRDSLAFRILYDSLPPHEAVKLLNCTKAQLKTIDPNRKTENLQRYGFNYHALDSRKRSFYETEPYFRYLSDMYYPQAVRFYKRREFDVRKFIYRSAALSPTPIYPDTLCWIDSTGSYFAPYANMYFWHPAYDNYPVVGLNEAQMRAYCDWLAQRMNETHADAGFSVTVQLPTLCHYELAVKACAGNRSRINTINTAPAPAFVIRRTPIEALTFIQRNYPLSIPDKVGDEMHRKLFDWQRNNQTYPIYYLAGNVSEYCAIPNDGDTLMTVLGGNRYLGIVDPNENQLNTVFFRQLVPSTKGSSTVGFRPVFYLEPRLK